MRNKFTELIEQGVASFNYTPVAPEIPEQDFVCRMYNNIFSIPTDTHMHLDQATGIRYITGHLIGISEQWESFVYANQYRGVYFKTSGYWCLNDFLQKNGLCGGITTLNGDAAYMVTPIPAGADMQGVVCPGCPTTVCTTESQIPSPIAILTANGDFYKIMECYQGKNNLYEVCEAMNNNVYVKGENWTVVGDKLMCPIGNKTYVL